MQKTNIIAADCIKREIKKYLEIYLSFVTDNKNFWKVVKPFTDKGWVDYCFFRRKPNLSMMINVGVTDDVNEDVSETLNSYLVYIVAAWNVRENTYITAKLPTNMEPIDKAVIKFQKHPSVLLIREKINYFDNTFSFEKIEMNKAFKEIPSLNHKKVETDN